MNPDELNAIILICLWVAGLYGLYGAARLIIPAVKGLKARRQRRRSLKRHYGMTVLPKQG